MCHIGPLKVALRSSSRVPVQSSSESGNQLEFGCGLCLCSLSSAPLPGIQK